MGRNRNSGSGSRSGSRSGGCGPPLIDETGRVNAPRTQLSAQQKSPPPCGAKQGICLPLQYRQLPFYSGLLPMSGGTNKHTGIRAWLGGISGRKWAIYEG